MWWIRRLIEVTPSAGSHGIGAPCYCGPVTPGHSPQVVVATHGHCFDGLCSAVMFTRLYRHRFPGDGATFTYHGPAYGPGQNGLHPRLLSGAATPLPAFPSTPLPPPPRHSHHHSPPPPPPH